MSNSLVVPFNCFLASVNAKLVVSGYLFSFDNTHINVSLQHSISHEAAVVRRDGLYGTLFGRSEGDMMNSPCISDAVYDLMSQISDSEIWFGECVVRVPKLNMNR